MPVLYTKIRKKSRGAVMCAYKMTVYPIFFFIIALQCPHVKRHEKIID